MHRKRIEEARSGTILVVACFILPVLCCIAAIAIDVGLLCNSRSRLQNAADAASLAAVLELWDQRLGAAEESASRTAAVGEAQAIVRANYRESGTAVAFGLWNGSTFTEVGTSASANAVRVRTSRTNNDAPGGADKTLFAGFLGMSEVEQKREAVAQFRPRGLAPFALWEGAITSVGQSLMLYDNTLVTPGVFGLLDFNGGENSAAETIDWVENGYMTLVWIPPDPGYIIIEGKTGFTASINTYVDDHIKIGDTIVACVYDYVWGTGENTYFRIVGFVSLVVTARGNTKVDGVPTKYIRATVAGEYTPGTGDTMGSMREFMALQLVK